MTIENSLERIANALEKLTNASLAPQMPEGAPAQIPDATQEAPKPPKTTRTRKSTGTPSEPTLPAEAKEAVSNASSPEPTSTTMTLTPDDVRAKLVALQTHTKTNVKSKELLMSYTVDKTATIGKLPQPRYAELIAAIDAELAKPAA